MKSIFENAYFGKAYKTRDGRKAIYSYCIKGTPNEYYLIVDKNPSLLGGYGDNGIANACGYHNANLDIISEWQEPVNEEELDRLAIECSTSAYGYGCDYEPNRADIEYGFKEGYRQAMEE